MDFIQRTIELARSNVEAGGRPFSCLIVKDGTILAEGVNLVAQTHDPTAHAEICAIRKATATLQTEHLTGCEFYILAHPINETPEREKGWRILVGTLSSRNRAEWGKWLY